ncbi:MAG: alpha/beta hydrolase [Gemmataceae bacterium]|nr:alpha/beta hydrolase [Gemmataceae bacterium]
MRHVSVVVILLLAGCLSVENALVYHPRPGEQPYELPPAPNEEIALVLADGAKLHARWAPHPRATSTVLFFHGNGGNIDGWGQAVREVWQQLDASVLIVDYPGYGHSEGKPSEAGCYAAADAAYRWLVEQQHVPPERIIVWGESLGGAVAVELASRQPHRALVLVRTFTSLPEVADDQLPLLASSLFLTNRFPSVERIGLCKSPVFIASAEKDRIIQPRHGQRLHAACTAPAELCVLRGIGHDEPLPYGFYAAVRSFLATKAPIPLTPNPSPPPMNSLR